MVIWRKPGFWLGLLGLAFLVFGTIERLSNKKDVNCKSDEIIRAAETDIQELNAALAFNENRLLKGSAKDFLRLCDSLKLIGLRFQDGVPEIWNSQDFQLQPTRENLFELIEQNGIYLAVWNRYQDTTSVILAYNIFDLSFPEITSNEAFNPRLDLFVGNAEVDKSKPLRLRGPWIPKNSDYFLVLFDYQEDQRADIFIFLGIIILSLGIYLWGIEQHNRIWAWFNFVLWVTFALMERDQWVMSSLSDWPIFSSKIVYFNSVFRHLGASFIWLFIGFWLLKQFLNFIQPILIQKSKFWQLILRSILWTLAILLALFAFQFTGFLVEKTEIHFRFTELLLISGTTFFSIGLIALIFALVISITHLLQEQHETLALSMEIPLFAGILVAVLRFSIYYCEPNAWKFAAVFMGLILLRIGIRALKPIPFRWITEIIVPSLLVSIWVSAELQREELQQREFFAASLMIEPDAQVKVLLNDAEGGLNKDLPIFVSLGFSENKTEEFENTLRQQYFGGLLENFDVSVFGFSPEGVPVNPNKSADFGSLNALYFSDGGIQVTKQFYLVNERRLSGSYIGKFSIYNDSTLKITYFILVSPSSAREKGRLTDVLNNSPAREILYRNRYSYAVYSGRTLSKHFGEYNYPINLNWPVNAKEKMEFSEPQAHHLIREDSYGNLIVVSRHKNSWVIASIQYTLFLLGGILFAILFYSWRWLEERLRIKVNPKHWQRKKTNLGNMLFSARFHRESWFISRRLQVYIVWLLLSIFGIVLYTTINYFTLNNSERQREELLSKVNQIANRISGQSNLDALVNQYEVGLIYDMAESYHTDINIFDEYGQLIVSTNPRLFKEQYRANYMNPSAFMQFQTASASTFVLNEKISELPYISAYSIINDNRLRVRGYVNLPYYSNRVDLYRQISSYLVTVVNVFLILFALVYIITQVISTRITQPLLRIRDEISRMKLGVRNEPIAWNRNDEVGLLVVEYNKMIDALDESLNKLSEVERQGAWREMAKQVAHEIKNPLTPMRLSLQHLEYAMSRNDANIEEKIKKTIQLLIRQIDSLSSMAEGFSSFAKMPEPTMMEVDFKEVLQDAMELMEREMGQTIFCEMPETEIKLMADPHQLGRVFTNLFKNAIQAIPDDRKGEIAVSLRAKEKEFTVVIRDNGKGIPKELVDKIFSPNFSTKNSGMGLGLAISKKIVEQFGGTIDFVSVENKGTTFTLTFPKL